MPHVKKLSSLGAQPPALDDTLMKSLESLARPAVPENNPESLLGHASSRLDQSSAVEVSRRFPCCLQFCSGGAHCRRPETLLCSVQARPFESILMQCHGVHQDCRKYEFPNFVPTTRMSKRSNIAGRHSADKWSRESRRCQFSSCSCRFKSKSNGKVIEQWQSSPRD